MPTKTDQLNDQQPDFVQLADSEDDCTWIADGIFDMWGKTSTNRWVYVPDRPSDR